MEISGFFYYSCILREIKVGESAASKTAILTHLEALTLDFHEFFQFVKAKIDKKTKIQSLQNCKKREFLKLLGSQKFISCKI